MSVVITILITVLIVAVFYPIGKQLGHRFSSEAKSDRAATKQWVAATTRLGAIGAVAVCAWAILDSHDIAVLVVIVAVLTAVQVALTWRRLRQPAG
jgi:hypothetical protein